jgi:Rad3-related DNA helicase
MQMDRPYRSDMLAAFPHPPYEIQESFMINAYEALQQSQIGLFESPTGGHSSQQCVTEWPENVSYS